MQDLFSKSQFPFFTNNPDYAFFDNASTSQIHSTVLEAMNEYYCDYRASPGRGEYSLANRAADAVDTARERVAEFLQTDKNHILFTTGATQSLNWIAKWNRSVHTVVVTGVEHNANLVPWLSQGRKQDNGLQVLNTTVDGVIDYEHAKQVLGNSRGGLLSITAKANVSGVDTNWHMLVQLAKAYDMQVCLDLCQAAVGTLSDSDKELIDAYVDWAVFSGHKMFGPTGIGVLYSKHALELSPMYGGGGMVDHLNYEGYNTVSGISRHQAGTPNTAGIIGMGVSCELLSWYGSDEYIKQLSRVTQGLFSSGLFDIPELSLIGDIKLPRSIYSFTSNQIDVSDLSSLIANRGVAVRSGRMCAYPYSYQIAGDGSIIRVSIAPYNNKQDCDKLVTELKLAINTLTQGDI